MSRKISNIGVLDLRKATEETVKEISQISNVGLVIYSPETSPLLVKLNIGNMGSSVEVPDDYKLFTGQLEFTRDYFESTSEPVSLVVTGQVFVRQDVTPEQLDKSLSGLIIVGQIVAPRNLVSILQKKIVHQIGQIVSYPEQGILCKGTLKLDNPYLESLEPSTTLVIMGSLSMIEPLDLELFDTKIKNIELRGSAFIREEYKGLLYKKTEGKTGFKVSFIPEGYEYFASPLQLDAMTIKRFDSAKIFSRRYVQFSNDIQPETIAQHISELRCKTYIICPETLREAVFQQCPDSEIRFLPYSGKLMIIEGDHSLSQVELEYTREQLNLVVLGDLIIEEDVDPDLLFEKVTVLDNFGDVVGDTRQIGVLKTKLRTRKGDMVDRTQTDEPDLDGMSNVGTLTL